MRKDAFAGYEVKPGSLPNAWVVQDAHGIPARIRATWERCYIKGGTDNDKGEVSFFFVGGRTAAMNQTMRLPAKDVKVELEGDSLS